MKAILIAGAVAGAVYTGAISITPQARNSAYAAGRAVTGTIGRAAKVLDEYLRCAQLEPTQQDYCRDRAAKQAKQAAKSADGSGKVMFE